MRERFDAFLADPRVEAALARLSPGRLQTRERLLLVALAIVLAIAAMFAAGDWAERATDRLATASEARRQAERYAEAARQTGSQ